MEERGRRWGNANGDKKDILLSSSVNCRLPEDFAELALLYQEGACDHDTRLDFLRVSLRNLAVGVTQGYSYSVRETAWKMKH